MISITEMDKGKSAKPPSPQDRLGFLLYRVGVQIAQRYAELLQPLGFTSVEVGLMTHLASGGKNHVRAIARTLGVSPQTIVNVAGGLEARQLLRRQKSKTDQRLVRMNLTGKGLQALLRIDKTVSVFDQELMRRVGAAETTRLTRALKKFLAESSFCCDA